MKADALTVAQKFGVSLERVKLQYARNAEYINSCARQAGNGKFRGYTADQWSRFANHARRQSQ